MATIVNHRISGTRVTVWDILHHLDNNWTVPEIADVFDVSHEQVQSAIVYIAEHEDEVREVHRHIEARNARGNPPEVAAKLAQARAKRIEWLSERQQDQSGEARRVGNRA